MITNIDFFTAIDLVSSIGWLVVFIAVAHIIYSKNKHKKEYKFYLPHFYWKVVMSLAFALIYIIVYGGGDTTAYWQGAIKLNKIFYDSPSNYVTELMKTPVQDQYASYFTAEIGRPPRWIYREPNSWFVCKVASVFSFFTFGSFITLNLFFGVISGWISWRFFRLMNKITNIQTRFLALAFLFIPSVGFWCSGLSKDTIVLCGIYGVVGAFFHLLYFRRQQTLFFLLKLAAFSYILFSTRPFILITIFFPICVLLIFLLNKNKPFIIRFLTRIIGTGISFGVLIFYLSSSGVFGEFSADKILQTAEVIQTDFENNITYTGKKYDLGIEDFSSTSMISVFPLAVATAIFRPFIWEAGNILMILNGLESLFLLYFTFRIIWTGRNNNSLADLFKTDYFIFSIIYVLILAYFVGFTSGLFGVLARLKAPILPFFVFILVYKMTKEKDELLTDSASVEAKD